MEPKYEVVIGRALNEELNTRLPCPSLSVHHLCSDVTVVMMRSLIWVLSGLTKIISGTNSKRLSTYNSPNTTLLMLSYLCYYRYLFSLHCHIRSNTCNEIERLTTCVKKTHGETRVDVAHQTPQEHCPKHCCGISLNGGAELFVVSFLEQIFCRGSQTYAPLITSSLT